MLKNLAAVIVSAFSIIFALSGCVSSEQFREYSAQERAQAVCGTSRAAKSRSRELSKVRDAVQSQQQLLSRGYRVHTSCNTIPIPCEDKNADNPYGSSSCGLFVEKTRKECHERPVSIDSSYEATVLNNARELERSLIRKDANMRASCEKVVRSMPSESAYRFYKSSSEPAH